MPKTLELLKKSPAVKAFEILDFKQGKNFYFLKVKAELVDVELCIREFLSEKEFVYSYHWQDENGKLRIRITLHITNTLKPSPITNTRQKLRNLWK